MTGGTWDSKRFERLNELFHRACELPEAERLALIDSQCADDALLREKLTAMLRLDRGQAGDLGSRVVGVHVGEVIRRLAHLEDGQIPLPARLGRYRLNRVVASGGMGTVYEAEQESPRRTLAIKLIRPEFATAPMLRRFRHEAEVLGTLYHPGVAQVLDAGTAEVETVGGVVKAPYIAMELVEGRELRDFVNHAKPSIRERLELFVRLCEAVQHAHQKGVIHRDLKPANIIVGESGLPKIVDFGVARLHTPELAGTLCTTPGQIVGTLAYMSPEQVSGDPTQIDSRSDVYSLGVILYELLAGRLPLAVGALSIADAARLILEADPPSLSALSHEFRGDLDTIVSKALQKKREDRYQSAAELGGDVRRYLSDEPIVARPASATYIMRKFARRHKALVAGAVAATAALVIGAIATGVFAVQAERARAVAVANERAMKRELALSTQAAKFMREMLNGVRPAVAAGRDRTMLREILDRTAERINRGELSEYPQVEAEIRSTIGAAYKDLGELDAAAKVLEGALAGLARADEPHRRLLAKVHDQLGTIRQDQGRLSEADSHYQKALEALSAEAPDRDVEEQAVQIRSNLAGLLRAQWNLPDAEQLFKEILAWRVARHGTRDASVASTLHNMAGVLADRGRLDESEARYREALDVLRSIHGDNHPHVAIATESLGNVLMWRLKFDEADEVLREALRVHLASQGENHLMVARSRVNLAELRQRQERHAEAVDLYSNALAGFEVSLKPDHLYVVMARMAMAHSLARLGDFASAEPMMEDAFEAAMGNPEVPEVQKRAARTSILVFYERWSEADPASGAEKKLDQLRARFGIDRGR
jgi:tetratricopeptide (TPR) repeat protein